MKLLWVIPLPNGYSELTSKAHPEGRNEFEYKSRMDSLESFGRTFTFYWLGKLRPERWVLQGHTKAMANLAFHYHLAVVSTLLPILPLSMGLNKDLEASGQ